MLFRETCTTFLALPRSERETLFLDLLRKPRFQTQGGLGEWFHAWLEDQCAEGRTLGEIAGRIDLPGYFDDGATDGWYFLERHVRWLLNEGHARLVRIEVLA